MAGILQVDVPALFPETGPVYAVLIGEAPGPKGADKTGIPFWGDAAGRLLYRTLMDAGYAQIPSAAWDDWDGERFRLKNLKPTVVYLALTNAFPRCPTNDGRTFRQPTNRELADPENIARLANELAGAAARSPARLLVVPIGERARWAVDRLGASTGNIAECLPHPSRQGLLGADKDHGRGRRMVDLEANWAHSLKRTLSCQPRCENAQVAPV